MRVPVRYDPKAALYCPLWANYLEVARSFRNEARQDTDTGTANNKAMLCIDGGRSNFLFKTGMEVVQIVQLRRIEQIGDLAHQRVSRGEFCGSFWHPTLIDV